MFKFLKLYFIEILFIMLIICAVYLQRSWLCDAYNQQVNLHLASFTDSIKSKNGMNYAKSFAEQSKDQFSYQLDRLIAFAFGGFGVIIIMQFNKKKNRSKI